MISRSGVIGGRSWRCCFAFHKVLPSDAGDLRRGCQMNTRLCALLRVEKGESEQTDDPSGAAPLAMPTFVATTPGCSVSTFLGYYHNFSNPRDCDRAVVPLQRQAPTGEGSRFCTPQSQAVRRLGLQPAPNTASPVASNPRTIPITAGARECAARWLSDTTAASFAIASTGP